MAQKAIGLVETKGLIALVHGTDAMLKAADVKLVGPMKAVGSGMVTAVVEGDVAAVKAAVDVGAQAASTQGDVISVQVIPRPSTEVTPVLPIAKPARTTAAAAKRK